MGNYSRGPMGTTLPTVTTDLRDVYGVDDLAAVLTVDDGLYSIQPASDQYPGHLYKVTILSDTMWYNWTGKVGVATSTLSAHFQIYNNNTSNFDTITTDNVTAANTNFTFAGTQAVSVANGYKDGSNVVCCRVYQEYSGETVMASYSSTANVWYLNNGGFTDFCETFTANGQRITAASFKCKRNGNPPSTFVYKIYGPDAGTYGSTMKPNLADLKATSATYTASLLSDVTLDEIKLTFASPYQTSNNEKLCLVISYDNGDGSNSVAIARDEGDGSGYDGNVAYNSGGWTALAGYDINFVVYGTP